MAISALHRIVAADSNSVLVVEGPKGEPIELDALTFEDARVWHGILRASGTPHRWQAYGGPRTGWNSVNAFLPSTEATA